MIILTDNIAFAQTCISHSANWQACDVSALNASVAVLAGELFSSNAIMQTEVGASKHWQYLLAVDCARKSQYDVLSRLAVSGCELPDKILCCAGSGDEFHGFKNRSWKACRGNIHLSAFIKPEREIPAAAVGFIVAAVTAALKAVESFELQGATPAIKWVNDILIQGAKVGGVLARLQTQARVTQSAVVGIGLNVEQRPSVERDPYVPEVAALSDFAAHSESCRHADVFPLLIEALGYNLEYLCQGNFARLLDHYRQRSLILGQHVTICEDSRESTSRVIAQGLVESIGSALELYIKDHPKPVTNGRLMMGEML
jgi:BirA family biotin operon repressor/biotin-[acetyl-CoA-carboxylase] ligase